MGLDKSSLATMPRSLERSPSRHRDQFIQRDLPLPQADADDGGLLLVIDADDASDLAEALDMHAVVGLEAGDS
jgi:hypothetical protein